MSIVYVNRVTVCGTCALFAIPSTAIPSYLALEVNDLCATCSRTYRPRPGLVVGSTMEATVKAQSPWWKAQPSPPPTVPAASPPAALTGNISVPPPMMANYGYVGKANQIMIHNGAGGVWRMLEPNSYDSATMKRHPISNPVCTCGGKKTRSTHYAWCDNPRDNQVDL